MACWTLLREMTAPTSLRRRFIQRMGASTSMRATRHRMAGFHRMASKMDRAADGVMTS